MSSPALSSSFSDDAGSVAEGVGGVGDALKDLSDSQMVWRRRTGGKDDAQENADDKQSRPLEKTRTNETDHDGQPSGLSAQVGLIGAFGMPCMCRSRRL